MAKRPSSGSEAKAAAKKELVLESVTEFCAEPELMVELYVNYDCDLQSTNLFETLCEFLATNAFAKDGVYTRLHSQCLEGLLAVVESIGQAFTVHASDDRTRADQRTLAGGAYSPRGSQPDARAPPRRHTAAGGRGPRRSCRR